jgi:hypothetical protein
MMQFSKFQIPNSKSEHDPAKNTKSGLVTSGLGDQNKASRKHFPLARNQSNSPLQCLHSFIQAHPTAQLRHTQRYPPIHPAHAQSHQWTTLVADHCIAFASNHLQIPRLDCQIGFFMTRSWRSLADLPWRVTYSILGAFAIVQHAFCHFLYPDGWVCGWGILLARQIWWLQSRLRRVRKFVPFRDCLV